MEDPSIYQQIKPQFPEHEHLKCPRCDSNNTKFCYYNNYNLSQPRHFCKNCKRYWTKGGSLRNIPIGGGSRKISKRSSNPKTSSPAVSTCDQSRKLLDFPGNFGNLMEGLNLNPNGSTIEQLGEFSENPNSSSGSKMIRNSAMELQSDNSSETFLGVQSGGGGGGGGGNGWPELAIYTPGSSFQQKTF